MGHATAARANRLANRQLLVLTIHRLGRGASLPLWAAVGKVVDHCVRRCGLTFR